MGVNFSKTGSHIADVALMNGHYKQLPRHWLTFALGALAGIALGIGPAYYLVGVLAPQAGNPTPERFHSACTRLDKRVALTRTLIARRQDQLATLGSHLKAGLASRQPTASGRLQHTWENEKRRQGLLWESVSDAISMLTSCKAFGKY